MFDGPLPACRGPFSCHLAGKLFLHRASLRCQIDRGIRMQRQRLQVASRLVLCLNAQDELDTVLRLGNMKRVYGPLGHQLADAGLLGRDVRRVCPER